MAKHLTDKQKKRIIADKAAGMTYRDIAAKYGVSKYTVEKTVKSDPQFSQILDRKKKENTLSMLEFLDARSASAQEFVDLALEAIKDPAKIQKASIQTIATALGIVIDKFTSVPKQADEGVEMIWGKLE